MNCFQRLSFFLFIASTVSMFAAEPIVVEALNNYPGGGLGTMAYPATEREKTILDSLPREQQAPVDNKMIPYSFHCPVGKAIAWFGIIREVKEKPEAHVTELLVEMKYFDGLTDWHQQIVSIYGAGDFKVRIPAIDPQIQRLRLIRVYGKVAVEQDGIPLIDANYVRIWPWGGFAFMDYGEDHSNPLWVKMRKGGDDVYASKPDKYYYEEWLGKGE